MAYLTVDGNQPVRDCGARTLGELLAETDERCARGGRIVTAVRLDGVDEPAFRDPALLARPLASIERIEIESGTRADLALQCLADAGGALDGLAAAGADAARHLRTGAVREGNENLAALTEGIGTVLAITGAASLGVGVDVATLDTQEGTLSDAAAEAARHLESLVAAQLATDWVAVADLLEHQLAPALRRWGRICRALRIPSAAVPVSPLQPRPSGQ